MAAKQGRALEGGGQEAWTPPMKAQLEQKIPGVCALKLC